MSTQIKSSKAPNLPVGPVQYAQRYQDQLLNILRLYFNQIDNITGTILGPNPNQAFNYAHVCVSDTTDQEATANDTATLVNWNTTDSSYGWTVTAPGTLTASYEAIYKLTYSFQFVNTDNAIHYVTVWVKINNVAVPNSATKFGVPARKSATAGEEGFICAYSEITFTANAGDEVKLYWATDKAYNTTGPIDGVYMLNEAAQTVPYAHPVIPSAVGSIVYLCRKTT